MRDGKITILCLLLLVFGGINERLCAAKEGGKEGKEESMSVEVQWLGHASFKITSGDAAVYIDPWKLEEAKKDGTVVLVSHSHYDHYSAKDIAKVSGAETKLTGSADVIKQEGKGQAVKAGETIEAGDVNVTGVAAYNPAKQFHPKSNGWLGFVVEVGGKRIYYSGDTDVIEEMKELGEIDAALLAVGGKYTMDSKEAAEAAGYIKPKVAIPYHWGDIVGGRSDAERFAEAAKCEVTILKKGESLEL